MGVVATFTTPLELVLFTLNQLGSAKTITAINPLSADKYTAYASRAYLSCVNEALSAHIWNFAKKTYAGEVEEAAAGDDPRATSIWKITSAGDYNYIAKVFLREDLDKKLGKTFHWWQDSNRKIYTNFDTTNVLHLENALFATVIAAPDIKTWGGRFCELIINMLKRPLALEETRDETIYKLSLSLDGDFLNKAIEEDDVLDARPWVINTY